MCTIDDSGVRGGGNAATTLHKYLVSNYQPIVCISYDGMGDWTEMPTDKEDFISAFFEEFVVI